MESGGSWVARGGTRCERVPRAPTWSALSHVLPNRVEEEVDRGEMGKVLDMEASQRVLAVGLGDIHVSVAVVRGERKHFFQVGPVGCVLCVPNQTWQP